MPPDNARLHPHLFDPNAATQQDFMTPRPGRGKALSLQQRELDGREWKERPKVAPLPIAAPAPPSPQPVSGELFG